MKNIKKSRRSDFCISCRENVTYTLQKRNIVKNIKDVAYTFCITTAICDKCGEEMSVDGLIDKNIREIDEQYRAYENIVSIEDIQKLMKIYNIGKTPLSLVLGFGEVTISRYLLGQIPSKEYSNIIKKALSSPSFMKAKLEENKEKISLVALNKAIEATKQLENLSCVSDKMLMVISYIFDQLDEVSPLALQKLLYFIQGESFALYGRPIFSESCQAWVHGPVYPEIYYLFKDFKFNPIDDVRFAILKGIESRLTHEEYFVIDLVLNTFGKRIAKDLEKITHEEYPWKLARAGYLDDEPSREPILLENIKTYYIQKNIEYGFSTEDGIKRYMKDILQE